MKTLQLHRFAAISALCLMPLAAEASHHVIRGRTGLPAVRKGDGNIWMEYGVVQMNASRHSITTTQSYRLHYPGPPLETGPQQVTITVREDYYRSTSGHEPPVTRAEARGFTAFAVTMDGRRITPAVSPWRVNGHKTTATRWRSWSVSFWPGQVRRMRIVSQAPFGHDRNRTYAEFVSNDLSGWRGAPNYLEIRFSAPGTAESRLAALTPRPTNVNPRAVQWVYRKARPRGDVYLQMPLDYAQTAYAR